MATFAPVFGINMYNNNGTGIATFASICGLNMYNRNMDAKLRIINTKQANTTRQGRPQAVIASKAAHTDTDRLLDEGGPARFEEVLNRVPKPD